MVWFKLVRALLFCFPAELAHHLVLKCLRFYPDQRKTGFATQPPFSVMGLEFNSRLGLAAGFDKNGEYIDAWFKLGFGFIEVGTVTPKPQKGNPKPRLFRLVKHQAIINRMGFNNKGVDYLVAKLRSRRSSGIVGVNIGKNKQTPLYLAYQDYVCCLRKVFNYADYIVINVSSPNTPRLRDLLQESQLNTLLSKIMAAYDDLAARHHKRPPILLKVTVDLAPEELHVISVLVKQYRLSGVISSNTTVDKSAVEGDRNASQTGGLSGLPLQAAAQEQLQLLRSLLGPEFCLIAVGGIMSQQDARDRIESGADLVQVYTGLVYAGPALVKVKL
jgi:dihydroorotate dehydrogenase